MKYSLSKRETDEIDSILDTGINQIKNTYPIGKNLNDDIKPYITDNSLMFSKNTFYNPNPVYNCFDQGTINSYNMNNSSLSRMKNDIKEVHESLNNLEKKLYPNNSPNKQIYPYNKSYEDINSVLQNLSYNYAKVRCDDDFSTNESLIFNNSNNKKNNSNCNDCGNNTNIYYKGELTPEDYKISKKYIIDDSTDNGDIIDKITEKEIEINKLRHEIENDERVKNNMKEEIEKLLEELEKERNEKNKKKEELENIKKYRNECEQMQFKFDTLMKQFDSSEVLRQKQKELLQKIQKDIDCLRQQSLNKINEIEMFKQINFENEQKKLNDDDCCNKQKTQKKKKSTRSKSKEKLHK